MEKPLIVWFRRDLRVADNPALHAAVASGAPVIPLYILDESGPWPLGGASRWWLHESLRALGTELAKLGAPLILRRGAAADVLKAVIAETSAAGVYWNRCYEPAAIARDKIIKSKLQKAGLAAESFNGTLLFEPWDLKTQSGTPFKVFTPFCRTALKASPPRAPLPAPNAIRTIAPPPASDALMSWALQPVKPNWAKGLAATWAPGEAAAQARLDAFRDDAVDDYVTDRDVPGIAGTSRLSPYLAFGEISAHQAWHRAARWEQGGGVTGFMRQIIWREFSSHLLYHYPHLPERPLREGFAEFPWRRDRDTLEAWQRGLTGYPIVDAGMRELWHTGWMHNRVRMVAASFLVKHLLLPWRVGEDWFWDTLVDADLANNAANWQWVAGCGTDAAPYFRVFNPVLQGEKFDADGVYVRRWVPELAALPNSRLHKPWEATEAELHTAGVVIGKSYPLPIVDHKTARTRALVAFAQLRAG